MSRILVLTACLAALVPGSFAQNARTADVSEEAMTAVRSPDGLTGKARPLPRIATPAPRSEAYADWEVWRNIAIAPGQSVNLDSDMYFSTADSARVSVRSRNADLPAMVMNAYWAVPQAEFYNATDVVSGDTFAYNNTGGTTFPTYGTRFRLRLTNTGTSTMFLSQVVVFARVL